MLAGALSDTEGENSAGEEGSKRQHWFWRFWRNGFQYSKHWIHVTAVYVHGIFSVHHTATLPLILSLVGYMSYYGMLKMLSKPAKPFKSTLWKTTMSSNFWQTFKTFLQKTHLKLWFLGKQSKIEETPSCTSPCLQRYWRIYLVNCQ